MIAFFKKLFGMGRPQLSSKLEPVDVPNVPALFNLDLAAGDLVIVRKSINEVVSCGQIYMVSNGTLGNFAWLRPHFQKMNSGIPPMGDDTLFRNGVHFYDGAINLYACKATPEEYELAKAQILCANKVFLYEIAIRDLSAAIPQLNIEELEKLHRELEYFYPMLDGLVNRHCAIPKEELNDQQ